ncbi:MAG: hypothetical protein ABIW76_03870 [Fibrobacteria bacterium]
MASADASTGERIFIFNGDADGIVAQHILGLETQRPDVRITGRKRDIELLKLAPPLERGQIHVLDVSLRRNLDALKALVPALDRGGLRITWYDHHDPGEPPAHPGLTLHINQAPEACTGVIVNAVLGHKQPLWAAMAAFGDNLPATASALASTGGASAHEAALLRRVGVLINYNAYGDEPGDALFEAADLAERMATCASALDFCWEQSIFGPLAAQFDADRERFQVLAPLAETPTAGVFLVPDQPYARRYGATWANERVMLNPEQALAVLHPRKDGSYTVSIRAPRDWRGGEVGEGGGGGAGGVKAAPSASDLAREFPTGGGRRLAAGINALPGDLLERFTERFQAFYQG